MGEISNEDANKMRPHFEQSRIHLKAKLESIENEIKSGNNQRRWIDWLSAFQSRVETLNSENMTTQEKRHFLSGILERVTITSHNAQDHELNIKFLFPYIEDQLRYIDTDDKSKGYELLPGRDEWAETVNLLKKNSNT